MTEKIFDTADLKIFGKNYILEWDKEKGTISITECIDYDESELDEEELKEIIQNESLETYDFTDNEFIRCKEENI